MHRSTARTMPVPASLRVDRLLGGGATVKTGPSKRFESFPANDSVLLSTEGVPWTASWVEQRCDATAAATSRSTYIVSSCKEREKGREIGRRGCSRQSLRGVETILSPRDELFTRLILKSTRRAEANAIKPCFRETIT